MKTITSRLLLLPLLAAVTIVLTTTRASAQPNPATVTNWSSQSSWDIPNEYVVDFDDGTTADTIRQILQKLSLGRFRPSPSFSSTKIEIVTIPRRLRTLVAKLRAHPRVEGVEPHAKVRALFVPNDPMYAKQWHLKKIGSEAGWNYSVGRGVTVAVIDTGIACESISGFKKASDLLTTRCVDGKNFIHRRKPPMDDHGHGTHVAGTIAQSTHNGVGVAGLAFGARLMPIKVLSASGWGSTTGVAAGIRWAADHGAHVINLSLGSPRNSTVLQRAITYARKRGSIIVAAAGNSGGSVGYPGASHGVIGVSATDSQDQLAWFSSRGKGVDIAAPGVNVLQQTICERGLNGCEVFSSFNGTSMASPHVAAAAALLVSLGVTDADAVERYLNRSATKLDGDADRTKFGAGRLQVAAAVSNVTTTQTLLRALLLLAMTMLAFGWAKKRDEELITTATNPAFVFGGWLTGLGLLFFAPWVLSRHHFAVDLLSRPLAEWDLLVGASLHQFLPLAHVGVPLLLTFGLLSVKGARPFLGGVAVGTAAYLISVALLGQLATPFGWWITVAWCATNAIGCLYLASLVLTKQKT